MPLDPTVVKSEDISDDSLIALHPRLRPISKAGRDAGRQFETETDPKLRRAWGHVVHGFDKAIRSLVEDDVQYQILRLIAFCYPPAESEIP